MPRVNFILPVGLLSPVCTYLENLKVLPATEALARLTEDFLELSCSTLFASFNPA